MPAMATCPQCSSWFSLRRKGDGKCRACGGGHQTMMQATAGRWSMVGIPRCPNCEGTGVCPTCRGAGEIAPEVEKVGG